MKVPELSKTHKFAIFCLVASIVVILILFSTPTADDTSKVDEEKIIKPQAAKPGKKIKPIKKPAELPVEKGPIITDSEKVSMEQLFAPYRGNTQRKTSAAAGTPIPVKQFAQMIIKEIDSFSNKDFEIIEKALLNADNLNIATIGLEFIKSNQEKLQVLGLELITKTCTSKTKFFKPNEFFMVYAQKGFAAEPFITEIIESTNDDFCREWACELYVDIFYHNTDDIDGRHRKLTEFKDKEKKVYRKIVKVFASEENVKKIVESKQRIGDQIRLMLGKENRSSLKMLAVIKLIDNLNEKNQYPTRKQLLKIIQTYNFNYNILNRVNEKPVDLPPIPQKIQLKYLSNAVFKNNNTNTFKWLHKKDGGFTLEEAKTAIKNNDLKKIKYMNSVLHKIICAVLRGKLLLGFGNHELGLLRYFYFANWRDQAFKWERNIITVRNMTGIGVPLILSQKPDAQKMLTGKGLTTNMAEEKHEAFYIPAQSIFVWFADDGDYTLSVNKKNTVVRPENLLKFDDKKFNINKINMTFDIY